MGMGIGGGEAVASFAFSYVRCSVSRHNLRPMGGQWAASLLSLTLTDLLCLKVQPGV